MIEYVSMCEREKEMSGVVRGTDCNESQPTESGPFLNILSLYVCVLCVCVCVEADRAFRNHFSLLLIAAGVAFHFRPEFYHAASLSFFLFFSPFFSADWLLIVYSK